MNIRTIEQSVTVKAGAHEVYESLMDSEKHARMTGALAQISREVGGKIAAWGDYIDGVNLELVPDEKIVQKWRASDWPEGHYSEATFELRQTPEGTELSFKQTGVPEEFYDDIAQGWRDWYWTPMKEMLEENG